MIVAILGAGPAGMSCANACLSFGLTPVVIERGDHVGGAQRTNFHPNLWMLGSPGESGEAMTQRLASHYASLPVTTHVRAEVTTVAREGASFRLTLDKPAGRESLLADAIVLATGMRSRATPELQQLAGQSPRVIVGPLSDAIRDGIKAAQVLILGGGDNALDHALFLAERGNRARVCTRGEFSARAAFLAACAGNPLIELRAHCTPLRLALEGDGIGAEWHAESRRFDWLLVMYGYLPNTEVLTHFALNLRPALTDTGHLHVDSWHRTSIAGIYAAGDVTDSPQPSVSTAIAQGLAAAKAIERDRGGDRLSAAPADTPAPTP